MVLCLLGGEADKYRPPATLSRAPPAAGVWFMPDDDRLGAGAGRHCLGGAVLRRRGQWGPAAAAGATLSGNPDPTSVLKRRR